MPPDNRPRMFNEATKLRMMRRAQEWILEAVQQGTPEQRIEVFSFLDRALGLISTVSVELDPLFQERLKVQGAMRDAVERLTREALKAKKP